MSKLIFRLTVLALAALAVSGPAVSQTRDEFPRISLRLPAPADGSYRVERLSGIVRYVPGSPVEPVEVEAGSDPLHLIEGLGWSEDVFEIRLGAGSLQSVQSDGSSVVLVIGGAERQGRQYRLGPDDVLDLNVFGEESLSGEVTVDLAGEVKVDLIGSVRAAGRTTEELSEAIRTALARDFLADPLVTVEVKRYRDQFITVMGPVARPGKIAVREPLPLSRVLSQAGGFAPVSGQRLTISREQADGTTRTFRIARQDLEDGVSDPLLLPDDLVVVSDPELVFVDGEVGQPGVVQLTPGLTLMKVIAVSRGTTPWANEAEVQIHRSVGGQKLLETYNLKKIRAHKAPDPELREGDLVVVPRRFL